MKNKIKASAKNRAECILARRALVLIEAIVEDAYPANVDPRLDSVNKAIEKIYRIVHVINSPACRKNHPDWLDKGLIGSLAIKL